MKAVLPKPVWDIAELFPEQGDWREHDYLSLPGSRLVEFVDGKVEVLPMPSARHQRIAGFLYLLLVMFTRQNGLGNVLIAPFRIKLRSGKFREPDVMFMFEKNRHKENEQYWDGADLVIEVVSPDDPERDTVKKRAEYAAAGIGEYWIVNPLTATLSVLTLSEGETVYAEHGVFTAGHVAESALLKGFQVDVAEVFAQ